MVILFEECVDVRGGDVPFSGGCCKVRGQQGVRIVGVAVNVGDATHDCRDGANGTTSCVVVDDSIAAARLAVVKLECGSSAML